jgi:hypothetical protein
MSKKHPEISLEYFCTIKVGVDKSITSDESACGTRRVVLLSGGTVKGPFFKGTILPGGADWQIVRGHVSELDTKYQFMTTDGVVISIHNRSIDVAPIPKRGKKEKKEEHYFRCTPRFEAPDGKYERINEYLYVGTIKEAGKGVEITVYRVL